MRHIPDRGHVEAQREDDRAEPDDGECLEEDTHVSPVENPRNDDDQQELERRRAGKPQEVQCRALAKNRALLGDVPERRQLLAISGWVFAQSATPRSPCDRAPASATRTAPAARL